MPFHLPSLRKRQSQTSVVREAAVAPERHARQPSKTHALQDFFRTTGANVKATTTGMKLPPLKTRRRSSSGSVSDSRHPRARATLADPFFSRQREPSGAPARRPAPIPVPFDIDDSVLDRLMGPPKDMGAIKKQSHQFLARQQMRVDSRSAAAAAPRGSQAQYDRKPLGAAELQAMFVGAPYFEVERVGGGSRPSVVYRGGGLETWAEDATDYIAFGHPSFALSTGRPYRAMGSEERSHPAFSETVSPRLRNGLFEAPSMLSANGADPGTTGFEYFLELPVPESTVLPVEPSFEKRKLLHSDPKEVGLREPNVEVLVGCLAKLRDVYSAQKSERNVLSNEAIGQMGERLFSKLLDSRHDANESGAGSDTMKTQITALSEILNQDEIWFDFSQVEWRVRLGQLLWSSQDEAHLPEETRNNGERNVFLLQITLAAELLVRLNAATAVQDSEPQIESDREQEATQGELSRKVIWDLLLAERFLENLIIATKANVLTDDTALGRRTSSSSTITSATAPEPQEDAGRKFDLDLTPRNERRQIDGLLHFAQMLHWPHTDELRAELETRLPPNVALPSAPDPRRASDSSAVSTYATPLNSPGFPPDKQSPPGLDPSVGHRTGYFADATRLDHPQQQQPQMTSLVLDQRKKTLRHVQLLPTSPGSHADTRTLEKGSWLSRSWFAGLVLPGISTSRLLIGALLENSPPAVIALGTSANLRGGFLYRGRSFWSKSCVVGRVLAATTDAVDCMGWVSVPGVFAHESPPPDGWADVDVHPDLPSTSRDARIDAAEAVAKDSDPLHHATPDTVQAGDFTTPVDGAPVMGNEVRSHGLSFSTLRGGDPHQPEAADSSSNGAGGSDSIVAHLTFSSPINSKLSKLSVPLIYDVHFVSSYPCWPSRGRKMKAETKNNTQSTTGSSSNDESSPAETPSSRPSTDDRLGTRKEGTDLSTDSPQHSTATPPRKTLRLEGIGADAAKAQSPVPAHPLHIDYHFEVMPVATLLSLPPETRSPAHDNAEATVQRKASLGGTTFPDEVVIIDCRGTSDLEVLARAWCAKVGEHALIGKSGRTCLACCVREARALGFGVVIRT